MIDEKKLLDDLRKRLCFNDTEDSFYRTVRDIVNEQQKVGEWIPCSERLPDNETEVQICARHKCRDKWRYTITSAHHQDGTMHTEDSSFIWEYCNFEYCEETDDYIIAEGWWEERHYNPDESYNNPVDDEVVAWMPLPEPYKEENKSIEEH